ncbi:MAG: anhydro-N-acetylmuramic acid kinase, partial [Flavobacteriaceae bacterium]|nr:anhydro-N-acetylmuramic acid kinase [Flavobacteriaceae bacterium]
DIDAICSHGHTIFHQPEQGITLQIGNLPKIAELFNCRVVCDFRTQDVKLGGQGAPLVPIGDRLLFGDHDICLNLGGFSNVSFERDNKRIAFDICPVNSILNKLARQMNLAYDDRGRIARMGSVHKDMLNDLNGLEFYSIPPPKSLGMEWVEQHLVPIIQKYDCSIEDKLRTFVEHIATQIAAQLNPLNKRDILVTGGGAYNQFLLERIKACNSADIVLPSNDLIDFKEALIFGFLGVLRLRNESNCLSSVTGAQKDHSSGLIY